MESVKINCPDCGRLLPTNAPEGLCPVCLLSATMGEVVCSEPFEAVRIQGDALETAPFFGPDQSQISTYQISPTNCGSGTTARFLGEYELHEEIGRGGMGTVYRAMQVRLNRQVALKMIRSGKFCSEFEIRRFRIEAQAAAQLDHPAIVPIFEIQECDGLHFFTMAYIDGQPLSARLRDGPLPPRDAATLLKSVAIGIQYAHEHGVVHRDLKPANILLDIAGQPRISDFGLAKRLSIDSATTSSGEILGTPSYMPPEQAQGKIDQIGPRSDVYSLGAVMYATLTGSPPFQSASPMETLKHVIEQRPISLRTFNPAIPKDLETIVLKCLEKEPQRRYPTARAVAEDLERFLGGHPITARPTSSIERFLRWANRRRDLSLLFIALLLLVGIGTATILGLQKRHTESVLLARTEGLVRQIETAEFSELPRLIPELFQSGNPSIIDRELSLHHLRVKSPDARIRLGLAQCMHRRKIDADTCREWLNLSLEDLAVIAKIVRPLSLPIQRLVHSAVFNATTDDPGIEATRLRAVCLYINLLESRQSDAVAPVGTPFEHAPDSSHRDSLARDIDWNQISKLTLRLLHENPAEFKAARELLRPGAEFLRQPLKDRISSDSLPPVQRNLAISLLGEISSDDPREIADLACLVDPSMYNLVTRHVERVKDDLIPVLIETLQHAPVVSEESGEGLSDERRVALAISIRKRKAESVRRQAMAAAWLVRLGRPDVTWRFLRFTPDASLRYAILDRIPNIAGTAHPLLPKIMEFLGHTVDLEPSPDRWPQKEMWSVTEVVSEMQMVILLAGEMAERGLVNTDQRDRLLSVLALLLRHHPNSGIHSSCEWTLRKLGAQSLVLQIQQNLTPSMISKERNWFVTPHGTTMAIFRGPVRFQAGADWTDPERVANTVVDPVTAKMTETDREPSLTREISRDFAIGTKEVSVREFLAFDPQFHERINQFSSSSLDHPVNNLNWYLAAEYCNWLSKQADLDPSEWCFIPNQGGLYAEGMLLAENYLQRTGYRMPTEAEWEFACRAGTTTPRFFGNCRELMPQFAWYRDNSHERALIVPGTLKPNDAGLFDVFGNVIEWCIDPYAGRPGKQKGIVPDSERGLTVDAEAWRVLRGGHLYAEENELRATDLWTFRPIVTNGHYGLRLARTLKVHNTN